MRTKYRCDRVSLGDVCQRDYDCEVAIKKSVCSKDKICVCRQNFHALNEFECVSPLHDYCLNNDECRFNSSSCVENKCQCNNNFRSVSSSQCVSFDFLYSCNEHSDCGDPWHNKCSADKKCVCNSNNISINKSTCLPLLNGYCWINHQCVVKNSFCDDFKCKCQRDFTPVSNNLCISV
ncbi:sortilin-related receptor-like [Microplitis mediator]|uniref:sortilin-related receptor-like n=1 Tax=Microplitis mediator TaxID=375433 RepID=UPI002554CD25|nr:sortilin-related receptor-like [Microplitis mediator]